MKTGLLILALGALLTVGSGDAHARDGELGRMLSSGRLCLTQISALRQTSIFRQHDFAGLLRRLAMNIDLAEAWGPHDHGIALGYARQAGDCEASVATWLRTRTPRAALMPAAAPVAVAPSDPAEIELRTQRYVMDLMSGRLGRRVAPAAGWSPAAMGGNWPPAGGQFR